MTNIDQALVDQMAQTITGALAGCDLRTAGAAVYGGNVAAGAVTPLIAAALDAARAEGYEQGKAAVREAVESVPDWLAANGMSPQEVGFVRANLRAALDGAR